MTAAQDDEPHALPGMLSRSRSRANDRCCPFSSSSLLLRCLRHRSRCREPRRAPSARITRDSLS